MGVFSKSNFHSDCNFSSYNLVMVSDIAKPLHQHEADVVYSTYKQKNTIRNFAPFDPFSLAWSHIIIFTFTISCSTYITVVN